MSSQEVLSIIASLNGGFNGDVPGKQIGVQITGDAEAVYTLQRWEGQTPTDDVEYYHLTLTAMAPPEPEEPEEA